MWYILNLENKMNIKNCFLEILAIVGFILSIYFYFNPKDTNDNILTIHLLNESLILQKNNQKLPKFDVTYKYDNKPVNELFFAEFAIENTSDNDITKDDFLEPLQFTTNAEILDIQIENSKNCKIRVEKKEKNKIVFNKDILKEHEFIKIRLFLDSKPTFDFSENNILNLNNKDIEVKYAEKVHRPAPKMPIGWYLPDEYDGWSRWSSLFKEDIIFDK